MPTLYSLRQGRENVYKEPKKAEVGSNYVVKEVEPPSRRCQRRYFYFWAWPMIDAACHEIAPQ